MFAGINAAGQLGRLPSQIVPEKQSWFGDEYFHQMSVPDNLCPDGTYLSRTGVTNYNEHYDPSANDNGYNTTPEFIGPHSYLYPYWNDECFNRMFCLTSSLLTTDTNIFTFSIQKEDVLTCYASCELQIGLYQPLKQLCGGAYEYYSSSDDIEKECKLPLDWAI
jgi:hypothetical protein